MLLEVPYKENDIISMKLGSGEEIVGKLLSEDEGNLQVSKPLMLTATQEGVGLAPFMFTVAPDAKYTFKKSVVLCVLKTHEDMAKSYIQNTTGISLA
jgi:hypothetical protein